MVKVTSVGVETPPEPPVVGHVVFAKLYEISVGVPESRVTTNVETPPAGEAAAALPDFTRSKRLLPVSAVTVTGFAIVLCWY
jgi:hypothetical protein